MTSSTDAAARATAEALAATEMFTSAHDGDGEHVASPGGGGVATVPKGVSVRPYDGRRKQIIWGRQGSR